MNPVHVHLMINHVSVLGTAFACILLIYSLFRGKEDIRTVALGIFVIVALITPVVTFSGDKSEDRVEKISGVTESAIKAHDEAAEVAFAAMVGLGVLALAQLILYKFAAFPKLRDKAAIATIFLSALAFAWVAYTANLGGKIRHADELGAKVGTGDTGHPSSGDED
jgi:hypothetical protein